MASHKFQEADDNCLADEKKESTSTEKTTKSAANILHAYIKWKGLEPADVEKYSIPELNDFLRVFYVEVKREDGTQYARKSLFTLRYGLQKHFNITAEKDIIHHPDMASSNAAFKAVIAKLRQDGKGARKSREKLTREDMETLYTHWFNTDTPDGLQKKTIFEFLFFFASRGRENLRDINKTDFVLERDRSGRECVRIVKPMTFKKKGPHSREEMNTEDCMYARPGDPRCPVASFKKYLSKLNPKNLNFWQRPKQRDTVTADDQIWYDNAPVGKNQLYTFMNRLSEEAKLSQRYSNTCVRITSLSILQHQGADGLHRRVRGHATQAAANHGPDNSYGDVLAKYTPASSMATGAQAAATSLQGSPTHRDIMPTQWLMGDVDKAATHDFPDHFRQLCLFLDEMRIKRLFCDLTLQLRDCDIAVHRCMMSAFSPLIKQLLISSPSDTRTVLKLDALSSCSDAVVQIVNYVYTGKLSLTQQNVTNVLGAARYLQMAHVEKVCHQYLVHLHNVTVAKVSQQQASDTLPVAVDDIKIENCSTDYELHHTISQQVKCEAEQSVASPPDVTTSTSHHSQIQVSGLYRTLRGEAGRLQDNRGRWDAEDAEAQDADDDCSADLSEEERILFMDDSEDDDSLEYEDDDDDEDYVPSRRKNATKKNVKRNQTRGTTPTAGQSYTSKCQLSHDNASVLPSGGDLHAQSVVTKVDPHEESWSVVLAQDDDDGQCGQTSAEGVTTGTDGATAAKCRKIQAAPPSD